MLKGILLSAALLAATGAAQADVLWVERDAAGAAHVYFGHWPDDYAKKDLARFVKSAVAYRTDKAKPLPIAVHADRMDIPAASGAGDVRLIDEGRKPWDDKREGGKTKTVMYSKAGRSETKPAAPFELVPTEPNGTVFTLVLDGKPQAKARVRAWGPPGWTKMFRTGDDGRVTIETPWAGGYFLSVIAIEQQAGGAGDHAHNRIEHELTMTFTTEKGAPWPPR
jgi:hypothetical protein